MPVEAWGSYPPEMNAGRYEGTGPGTWLAATASWATMATDAAVALGSFLAQKGNLATEIFGISSASQIGAAGTFGGWLGTMHGLADVQAVATQAAATAYTLGQSTMVPVPAVTANRTAEAAVVSSSILGAADPTAVALNLQYGEMWGQNGSTMMAYDSAATTATALKGYPPPPPLVTGVPGENAAKTAVEAGTQSATKGTQSATKATQQSTQQSTQMVQQVGQMAMQAGTQAIQMPMQLMQAMTGALTQAMQPVQSVMGQLATPMNGVLGNGLGSGSGALGSSAKLGGTGLPIRGGLPLGGMSMGGLGTKLGGGGIGGLGGGIELSGGLNKPASTAVRLGPSFNGVPVSEKQGTTTTQTTGAPMGGAGAMGPRGAGTGKGRAGTEYVVDESNYRPRRERSAPAPRDDDADFD